MSSPTSRSIRRKTSAPPAASTRSCRAQSTVRCGVRSACSEGKCGRAARSRPELACNCARRNPRRSAARLCATRRRHRQPRVCGCRSAAAISAASTAQMQGSAERAQSHLRSLPGGLGLLPISGPGFAGIGGNSAEASYYTWVDQHNTLGLGNDVPTSTGNETTRYWRW